MHGFSPYQQFASKQTVKIKQKNRALFDEDR